MEDASHKLQTTLDQMLSGRVKRLAVPRIGGGKRAHKEDGNVTPTPSNGSLSTGEFSDIEILSEESRVDIPLERDQSTGSVIESKNLEREKLRIALKLDRLKDKLSRYESHIIFLNKCVENSVIPNGLRAYVEPSIGNRDDVFLEGWHSILFDCSQKLIKHSVEFSGKIVETTKTEIKTTEDQLKALLTDQAYIKVDASLKKNDEIRVKDLTNRKNRKFYRLKYGEKEREDRQPTPNNRNNEILNNRGQRGLGQPRRPDDNFTRRDTERPRRNEGQSDRRLGNNNYSSTYTGDDQAQRRVIEVIERRNNNPTGRGPRANNNNQPLHEKIALSRRNSRRNLAHNNESPREDFPPLRRETGDDQQPTNRMDDMGRERSRNNEIEALRRRIDALQRERNNSSNHHTTESTNESSKNGNGAQGPSVIPTNDGDMKQFIKSALATISAYAERLDRPSDSARTLSETS